MDCKIITEKFIVVYGSGTNIQIKKFFNLKEASNFAQSRVKIGYPIATVSKGIEEWTKEEHTNRHWMEDFVCNECKRPSETDPKKQCDRSKFKSEVYLKSEYYGKSNDWTCACPAFIPK